MKTALATIMLLSLFCSAANAERKKSIFDILRDNAPRSDGVFGTLQNNAP